MSSIKKLKNLIKREIIYKNKGIVLMYHRVTDMPFDPWKLAVTPKNFEEQMIVLKKYGNPVQMQKMGRTLHSHSFRSKQIVVTFDDGYADNYNNAKPILERLNIPATFFIVTGMVDRNEEYWWDDLEKIILLSEKLPEKFRITINNKEYFWTINPVDTKKLNDYSESDIPTPNDSVITRNKLYFILWKILSYLSVEDKKMIIPQIARWADLSLTPRPSHKVITKEELINLSGIKLFEIGAHTQNHPFLAYLDKEGQRNEIKNSKEYLEKTTGRPVKSFSYPHGSFNADTVDLVRELGFKASCTVNAKKVTKKDDPLLLPRFAVQNWSGLVFEKKLHEWMEIL